jgi:2-methylisocitrate lyase-like PEP mutase family enzyme
MTTSAETFRSLHQGPNLRFLPNAWDAVSAKLLERAGITPIRSRGLSAIKCAEFPREGALSNPELSALF